MMVAAKKAYVLQLVGNVCVVIQGTYSIVLHELQNPEGKCLDIVLDLVKQTRFVTNGPQISYHLMWICAVTLMSPLLRGLLLFVVNAV